MICLLCAWQVRWGCRSKRGWVAVGCVGSARRKKFKQQQTIQKEEISHAWGVVVRKRQLIPPYNMYCVLYLQIFVSLLWNWLPTTPAPHIVLSWSPMLLAHCALVSLSFTIDIMAPRRRRIIVHCKLFRYSTILPTTFNFYEPNLLNALSSKQGEVRRFDGVCKPKLLARSCCLSSQVSFRCLSPISTSQICWLTLSYKWGDVRGCLQAKIVDKIMLSFVFCCRSGGAWVPNSLTHTHLYFCKPKLLGSSLSLEVTLSHS